MKIKIMLHFAGAAPFTSVTLAVLWQLELLKESAKNFEAMYLQAFQSLEEISISRKIPILTLSVAFRLHKNFLWKKKPKDH